ncbi:MAG TPA: archease [Clostridia bacterium]|nr:archease [Clostridia bacterium]
MSRSPGFEILDHTADIRLASTGKTLEETMFELIKGVIRLLAKTETDLGERQSDYFEDISEDIRAKTEREIRVTAPNLERAVVTLLNEIIYLYDAEGFEPSDVSRLAVDRGSVDGGSQIRITVGITGIGQGHADAKERRPSRIKAATYHGIVASDTRIEVVFDT